MKDGQDGHPVAAAATAGADGATLDDGERAAALGEAVAVGDVFLGGSTVMLIGAPRCPSTGNWTPIALAQLTIPCGSMNDSSMTSQYAHPGDGKPPQVRLDIDRVPDERLARGTRAQPSSLWEAYTVYMLAHCALAVSCD